MPILFIALRCTVCLLAARKKLSKTTRYAPEPDDQPPTKSPKASPSASPSKPTVPITPVQPLEEAIKFLKDKGVYQDEDPVITERRFSLLFEPSKAGVAENHYRSVQQRLLRLTSADAETHSDTVPATLHTFKEAEFLGTKRRTCSF